MSEASQATTGRISVVLPTYDRAETLPAAIASVLEQTVPVHEVIVVDDGSTDASADIVARAAERDSRVRLVQQRHLGATAARNRGISEAQGELVAFQDSDDLWLPTFVEHLGPSAGPGVVVFGTCRAWAGSSSSLEPLRPIANPRRSLRRTNLFSTQSAILDGALLRDVRFDGNLRRFQDWDLWLSLIEKTDARLLHVPVVVVDKFLSEDSITRGDPRVRDASIRRILRRHWRLFARDPLALARTTVRGVVRPVVQPARRTADRARARRAEELA
ncbi:glycosyltransferase family 2 protein [Isoptericola sp. NEAU-Y5]|uniref:Glycosyltransferase family 2 protein n=1 Tax=Isoptericola luteus TaxID=2879484 RepID=A0ABS7ZD86_9MICO|nr:glycosyltransferase family 2 protein [Isoptericola sp. NEAU-Y5]MCA5893003.1 glycosyltransferase family 2 protein [Isoptericola sp. NEAU-Y5]